MDFFNLGLTLLTGYIENSIRNAYCVESCKDLAIIPSVEYIYIRDNKKENILFIVLCYFTFLIIASSISSMYIYILNIRLCAEITLLKEKNSLLETTKISTQALTPDKFENDLIEILGNYSKTPDTLDKSDTSSENSVIFKMDNFETIDMVNISL
jgi:hypothetical protein